MASELNCRSRGIDCGRLRSVWISRASTSRSRRRDPEEVVTALFLASDESAFVSSNCLGGTKKMKDAKLRLWPGVVAGILIVIGLGTGFLLTIRMPDTALAGILGAMVGTLAVVVWWLFFSRVPWSERLGTFALLIGAWFAMRPFLDRSITGGAMGALPVFAFPVLAVALVVWASVTRHLSVGIRRGSLVAAIMIACGLCTLVKTAGIRGGFFEFHWRWTPTPEQRLLARGNDDPAPIPLLPPPEIPISGANASPVGRMGSTAARPNTDTAAIPPPLPPAAKPADWPGFRGPDRDGIVHNVRIETDWSKFPPAEMWRQPIGPGWSSFAVDGDVFYTQEQRGNDEIVASYRLGSGKPVWRHRDAVRFYESNGGAGPRGTPSLVNGRVYTLGGTGVLNALDAGTGAILWSRNVSTDTGVKTPIWGFSSSPLVMDDIVVVAAEGTLAAYDIASGKSRWTGPAGGFSYSSPHRVSL